MRMVMVDSTVQEKNITFPTDSKLYRKIIADEGREEGSETDPYDSSCDGK